MGEFGSGKTQNTTAYLKWHDPTREINITNYYTGYSHFQISSHFDLIAILNDIYDYHQYINLLPAIQKIYSQKQSHLPGYLAGLADFLARYVDTPLSELVREYVSVHSSETLLDNLPALVGALRDVSLFRRMKRNLKFNIVLDESSIYFNPRNFAKNFSGENERLLDFIYQPRKLNVLMFVVVQSPMELDVKFRRLATYYRKYYKGLRIIRWHRDYYFLDPEEIDLEKAEQVDFGINFNLYPFFPVYDYNTKELIRPGDNIYQKGAIFSHIKSISSGIPLPTRRASGWFDDACIRFGLKRRA